MSVFSVNDAVQHAKLILNDQFQYFSSFWLKNAHRIESTCSFFEDEESRCAYKKELIFKLIKPIIGEKVNVYLNALCQSEFNALLAQEESDLTFADKYGTKFEHIRKFGNVCTLKLLQYQYKDFVSIVPGDVVLDAGACFGETAVWAMKMGARSVYSFEIDPTNLQILEQNKIAGIHIVPQAVGATTGDVKFTANPHNPAAGALKSSENEITVPMTTIDIWCKENNVTPTFIKMDIEGSELSALRGAESILRNFTPKLAICLYHKPQDMFEIPEFIKSISCNYKLYCKKNHPVYEFILYAVHEDETQRVSQNEDNALVTPDWFDEEFYLNSNPDVAASSLSPFYHYSKFGVAEGRLPKAKD